MALRTPPSWLQQGSHTAENDRLGQQALVSTSGIIGSGSLAVSQSATPALSVSVAQGWAGIVGTTQSNMGVYVATNDAAQTLTISTPDATNPRIDRIVLTVNDAYYTGVLNNATFTVVAGTPASSPVAPTTPANSISLATIAVAANAATIVNANITDTRTYASSNIVAHGFTLSAGTATRAPITLTAGAALTTQTAGSIEYDGTAAYLTPSTGATNTANGGRGSINASHFYQLTSPRSLSPGNNTAQSLYGVGLGLAAATTYEVDAVFRVSYVVSAPIVALTFQLAATAPTAINMQVDYFSNTTGFATASSWTTTLINAVATPITLQADGSVTTYYTVVRFKGTIRTNAATAFTPQLVFTTNTTFNTPTVAADSYIKVTPLATSTATAVGAWS